MNLYIALILFLCSFLILMWGYKVGMRHNGRNKQNDAYFVMSLSNCIWSAPLAIMMLCPQEQCSFWVAVSLWGVVNFTVQLLLFMLTLYGDTLLYKIMYFLVPALGIVVWALRVFCDSYEIVETKYGYFYKDKVCLINVICYIYIFLLAIGAIIVLCYYSKGTVLKREKVCVGIWIGLIVFFAIILNGVSFYNMFAGVTTTPFEGLLGCLANLCFYFIADYADMMELPKEKVEAYVTDYLSTPIVFLDYKGDIIYCNEAFEYFFHLKKDEIIGTKMFYESIHTEAAFEEDIAYAKEIGSNVGSFKAWTVDGERALDVKYRIIYDRFGDTRCVINIVNDVTEEEMLLHNLEQQKAVSEEHRREAIRANQSKSKFLAHVSHEIRTPMNAILGMNQMVMQEEISPKAEQYSQNISTAGQTLLSIINDILDLSKIESGKMEIVPVTYGLSSLLNDVLNMVAKKVQDKNLLIETEIASDIPHQLCGDEVRIRQILLNLINNAVKYTQKGTVTLKVDWEKKEEKWLELKIAVADTGIGIREEDLANLFESFQRVDMQNNHNIEGTGLGLSIAKQLVEQMEGSINVESVYGEGTTFFVNIPQKIIDETPMGEFSKAYREAQDSKSKKGEEFTAPDARILIVDDNKVNLVVAKGLLKETKMKIDTALSGFEALEKIKTNEYQIIFLDDRMPEMGGIETLDRMLNQEENCSKNATIIAMTANAISGSREHYLAAGFRDYLSKPIDIVKYTKMIKKYLPEDMVH